jgi:glutathione peroxidase-family protein
MKSSLLIFIILSLSITVFSATESVYDFELKDIKGKVIKTKSFKGQALMIVNIATRCGYTGQLDDIEKLYKKYKVRGLTIIGIPSNDFGGQTPEDNNKIAEFCRLNYNVTFPLVSKTPVTGKNSHPFVKHLVKASGGKEIGWNFEKFIISKDGKSVKRFGSSTKPLSDEIEKVIKDVL